jgi:hypothetical protein
MDDVTPLMDDYREAVRHLWNTHFRRLAEADQDWDLRDAFDEIAARLFGALVLRQLDEDEDAVLPAYVAPEKPIPFLRLEVDPRSSIMVARANARGYWDDPLTTVEKGDLRLCFIQFFDWSVLGFREFGLYHARILKSDRYPHVVGRDALVPVGATVRVVYAGAAEQRDAPDKALS